MKAILSSVQPFEIHGTRYYRIAYALKDAPETTAEGRVATEGIYKDPQPGDQVEVRMLLGIIDEVKKL